MKARKKKRLAILIDTREKIKQKSRGKAKFGKIKQTSNTSKSIQRK